MKTICDVCGKYSDDAEVCSNCGRKIVNDDDLINLEHVDNWGWAIFTLGEGMSTAKQEVVNYLREKLLSLENMTAMKLISSQLCYIEDNASEIRILMREDFLPEIQVHILSMLDGATIQFEPEDFTTADEGYKLLQKVHGHSCRT